MMDENAPYGMSPDGDPLDKFGDPAPWGLKTDGTPASKPGRKPGQANGTGKAHKAAGGTAPAPSKKPTKKARPARTSYVDAISAMLQLPAAALSMAGQYNPAFAYDGAAIALHAPTIAQALDDTAQVNPAVAAALDRVMQIGPYGAIIVAVAPLAAQILTNHKMLPVDPQTHRGLMGAVAPELLIGQQPPAAGGDPEPEQPTGDPDDDVPPGLHIQPMPQYAT